jgi:multiple antibiotic resistance protein
MNFVTNSGLIHISIVIAVFALMIILTYIFFLLSDKLVALLGNNVISVIGKIMGLIIAIIGANMVIEGIKIAFSL